MVRRKISLGFTSQEFEEGAHICQVFSDEEERREALVDYVVSGLKSKENVACFSEKETQESIADFLEQKGLNYEEIKMVGTLKYAKTSDAYFGDGKFDPDRMLKMVQDFYEGSLKKGKDGARVIGEMTPDIEHLPGGSRLLEYESKVSLLLKKCPVTAVCQYDAREFDGATIMNVLKVHPYMIIRGSVVNNPFFIKPEEYLASISKNDN